MGFKNRISNNPNRKKLHVESIETDSGGNIQAIVIRGIERLDEPVDVEGTKLEAKSFLRALIEIETNGIVEDSDDWYWFYNVGYGQSSTFRFNYLGPKIEAYFDENHDYFTADATNINENQIDVTLIAKPAAHEIEYSTEVYFDVNFRVVHDKKFVTTKRISISMSPEAKWPND